MIEVAERGLWLCKSLVLVEACARMCACVFCVARGVCSQFILDVTGALSSLLLFKHGVQAFARQAVVGAKPQHELCQAQEPE